MLMLNSVKREEHAVNLIVFEYASISEGLKICDDVLTQYQLELVKHDIRCPGRYSCLLSGSDANVKQVERYLQSKPSVHLKSFKAIYNLREDLLKDVSNTLRPEPQEDMLIIETNHLVDGYYVLDQLLKRSSIRGFSLLNRLGLFGKGVVMVTGKTQSIQLANRVLSEPDMANLVWHSEVIQSPSFDIIKM